MRTSSSLLLRATALTLFSALAMCCRPADAQDASVTLAIPTFQVPSSVQSAFGSEVGRGSAGLRETLVDLIQQEFKQRIPGLVLTERREIDVALKELALDENSLYAPGAAANRLGQFVKADFVLLGTVVSVDKRTVTIDKYNTGDFVGGIFGGGRSNRSNSAPQELIVSISGRLIDVARNTVFDTRTVIGSHRIPSNGGSTGWGGVSLKAAQDAAKNLAVALGHCFNNRFKVTAVLGNGDAVIDAGEQHGIKLGQKFRLYRVLKVHKGERGEAGFEEREEIGIGEIVEVQNQASRVRLQGGGTVSGDRKTMVALRFNPAP